MVPGTHEDLEHIDPKGQGQQDAEMSIISPAYAKSVWGREPVRQADE